MQNISEDQQRVAVFGAAGHTGRFVVAELLRRGLRPIAVGRDERRLAEAGFPDLVERRVGTVEDPTALDQAISGAAAVINCAGPFLDTARPIVEAAVRAGAHYFDVTAEQASAQDLFDRYDAAARQAGVVVMPAMSFSTAASPTCWPRPRWGTGIAPMTSASASRWTAGCPPAAPASPAKETPRRAFASRRAPLRFARRPRPRPPWPSLRLSASSLSWRCRSAKPC